MGWVKAICAACYEREYGVEPCRVLGAEPEECWICHEPTQDGIYVRRDPKGT